MELQLRESWGERDRSERGRARPLESLDLESSAGERQVTPGGLREVGQRTLD